MHGCPIGGVISVTNEGSVSFVSSALASGGRKHPVSATAAASASRRVGFTAASGYAGVFPSVPGLRPMTSDGEALFRAICEQPWEDTPRLAYADWLQENG